MFRGRGKGGGRSVEDKVGKKGKSLLVSTHVKEVLASLRCCLELEWSY